METELQKSLKSVLAQADVLHGKIEGKTATAEEIETFKSLGKQAKDIAGLARLILDTHVGTINNSTSGLPDFRIMGDEHETPFQFSLYLPLSEQEMLELQKATSSGVNLSS